MDFHQFSLKTSPIILNQSKSCSLSCRKTHNCACFFYIEKSQGLNVEVNYVTVTGRGCFTGVAHYPSKWEMWSCWGRLLPSGSAIGPSLTSPGWYSHESQNPNFLSIIMITMILSFWLSKLVISKMLMSKINTPNCPATDWRPFQGLCPASCHMVPGIGSSPATTLIRTSRRQWMDELPKLLFLSYMKS